jgi:SPP1 gp7 family putative phage head morphogenesis protein
MAFTAVWGHSKETEAVSQEEIDRDSIEYLLMKYKRPTTLDSTQYYNLITDDRTREMIYKYEPVVNLIITALKNMLFQNYSIITEDESLKEKVEEWINEIGLINTNLHGDSILEKLFVDYLVYGQCFAQLRYKNGELDYVQRIDPATMEVRKSPFDDRDVFFIQRATYVDLDGKTKTKTIYFIRKEHVGKVKVEEGAEIGKAENILWFKRNGGSVIDKCVEYVLAKWDILRRMPTTVMRYSAPFIHGIVGKFDKDGNPMFPTPPADDNDEVAKKAYEEFKKQLEALSKEFENWDERKELFTDPFVELKVIETSKSIDPKLYETTISLLNKEITFSLLASIAMVDARGVELATSRTIADFLNRIYRGMQQDFEKVVNFIIKKKFNADVRIKFADINPEDANNKADRLNTLATAIKTLKDCGASTESIQNILKEFGLEVEFEPVEDITQHSQEPEHPLDPIIADLVNKIMEKLEESTLEAKDKAMKILEKNKGKITATAYRQIRALINKEFQGIDFSRDIQRALKDVVKVTGLDIDVDKGTIKFVENYTFDLCKKLTENQKARLRHILLEELSTTEDTNITEKIMQTLKTTRYEAERIARTELSRAYEWSRYEYYKKYAEKNNVKVIVRWYTRKDGKCCAKCQALEGKEWDIDKVPVKPPLHPNCRCSLGYKIVDVKK